MWGKCESVKPCLQTPWCAVSAFREWLRIKDKVYAMKKDMQSARKEKLRRAKSAKNKKGKASNTPRAKAKMRHQPSDERVSLKATPSRKKPLKKQEVNSLPTYEQIKQELQRTGSISKLLGRLGKGIKLLGVAYRKNLYHEVAKIYALGQIAATDYREWEALSGDPVWAKYEKPPTEADQADALRYAMLRAFGLTRAGQQKASKYYCALKGFFADEVPANDLPAKIKEARGIGALARANAEGAEEPTPIPEDVPGSEKPQEEPAVPKQPSDGETKPEAETSVILCGTLVGAGCELLRLKPPCSVRLIVDIQERRGNEFGVVITDASTPPKDGRIVH